MSHALLHRKDYSYRKVVMGQTHSHRLEVLMHYIFWVVMDLFAPARPLDISGHSTV